MRLKHNLISFLLPLVINILGLSTFVKGQQMIRDAVIQTPLDPKEDLAYARFIFANGSEQYFRNWECPDGLWSEENFAIKQQPRCICVKGAFAISKELCDEAFEILTGDEHCYDVGSFKIRKITPLTGQGGLKGKANTVFRKDAAYFARLVSPTPTSTVLEPVDYIFRLNDPYDFSAYISSTPEGYAGRLGCFPGQAGTNQSNVQPVMNIGKLPSCANEFRGPQAWCGKTASSGTPYLSYTATIRVGTKWSPRTTGAGSPYPGSCRSLSSRNRANTRGRKKRSASSPLGHKTKPAAKAFDYYPSDPIHCTSLRNSTVKDPPQIGAISPIEYFVDRSPYPIHSDFHTWERFQQDTNEQTHKIMRNVLDYHLGYPEDRNDTKIRIINPNGINAFRYVQISRMIIESVCPQEHVPTYLLAFMIRLFRIILLDLQEKYKYNEYLVGNSQLNTDILTALNSCKAAAKPINFMVNDTCKSQGVYGTNDSTNATNVYYNNINLTMPPELVWTSGSVDFPLETVWKMMAFVHYYCASHFSNPTVHSQYVVKVEAFFNNPSALFRWYNPGPANQLIRSLLPTYDLTDFAQSIDRCVSTARELSKYKGWLRRPADSLAFYQKKFDISKYTTPAPAAKSSSAGGKPYTPFLRRTKRFYAQNNIWQGQAYCLHNSKSILTEVRSASIYQCKSRPAWFHNTDYYFY